MVEPTNWASILGSTHPALLGAGLGAATGLGSSLMGGRRGRKNMLSNALAGAAAGGLGGMAYNHFAGQPPTPAPPYSGFTLPTPRPVQPRSLPEPAPAAPTPRPRTPAPSSLMAPELPSQPSSSPLQRAAPSQSSAPPVPPPASRAAPAAPSPSPAPTPAEPPPAPAPPSLMRPAPSAPTPPPTAPNVVRRGPTPPPAAPAPEQIGGLQPLPADRSKPPENILPPASAGDGGAGSLIAGLGGAGAGAGAMAPIRKALDQAKIDRSILPDRPTMERQVAHAWGNQARVLPGHTDADAAHLWANSRPEVKAVRQAQQAAETARLASVEPQQENLNIPKPKTKMLGGANIDADTFDAVAKARGFNPANMPRSLLGRALPAAGAGLGAAAALDPMGRLDAASKARLGNAAGGAGAGAGVGMASSYIPSLRGSALGRYAPALMGAAGGLFGASQGPQ